MKTYALDGVQTILAYPFKDSNWQSKFAIGVALFFASYFIPIVPMIFVAGYFAKIMHSVISEEAEPALPEWDQWGDLFNRGAKVVFAALIYLLPALLFLTVGYLIMFFPAMLLPIGLDMADADPSGRLSSLLALSMFGTFIGFAMLFIGLLFYFPALLILPPAIAHLVATNSFAAAFHIRSWARILRANLWGFFTTMAVVNGVASVLSMLVSMFYFTLIFAPFIYIGLALIWFYVGVIAAPFLGEAYRKGVNNLAETTSE